MHYIIMDLEWNVVYLDSAKMYINEIIEVGAIKLNENIEVIDSFNSFVKPIASKKIRKSIRELTQITMDNLVDAEKFKDVMRKFESWAGEDFILLSWGDSDVRTLISNYKYFDKTRNIEFIKKYCDLQLYVQKQIKSKRGQQLGLSNAAECLGIDQDKYEHHRALQDSMLSAECLKKTFDKERLDNFVRICDKEFFERFAFRPYYIRDIDNKLINKNIFECRCDVCKNPLKIVKPWKTINNSFRAVLYCKNCDRKITAIVRVRKLYDKVSYKKSLIDVDENEV